MDWLAWEYKQLLNDIIAILPILSVWPISVAMHFVMSHTLAVLSLEPAFYLITLPVIMYSPLVSHENIDSV